RPHLAYISEKELVGYALVAAISVDRFPYVLH
ncbi:MAG: hypothetical protein RI960_1482, partial [Pseudomonadota bacterium]